MRTFRNPLIGLVCLSMGLLYGCEKSPSSGAPGVKSDIPAVAAAVELVSDYLPLQVGNRWTYECSIEGEDPSEKVRTIVAATDAGPQKVFRSEWQIPGNSEPLVEYLSVNASNQVVRSREPNMSEGVPLINAAPQVGDRLGDFTVATVANSDLEKFTQVLTAKIETFSYDEPDLPEAKRLTWLGRSYGKGIGLLEEADGAGGACVLTTYTVGGKTN